MKHVNFDSELLEFFKQTSGLSRIVDIINIKNNESGSANSFTKDGDFFKKEDSNHVSFIPKSKLNLNHNGFNEEKLRQKIKIGRFVKKVLTEQCLSTYWVSSSDIESFVNFYKSFFDRDINKLKIIEGDEILKYYHQNSYFMPSGLAIGQLWKSCMRYHEKNRYMEIYSKNPESVKMLILLAEDGQLKSRALLWQDAKDTNGNSYKVMDRIYSIYDHDVLLFKEWALKNGYIHKLEQSAKSENLFTTQNGIERINLKIRLNNHICDYYPYVDSFKWYSKSEGTISNSFRFKHEYVLIQNDGSLFKEEEMEEEVEYFDEF
jgi:hypothetical protein